MEGRCDASDNRNPAASSHSGIFMALAHDFQRGASLHPLHCQQQPGGGCGGGGASMLGCPLGSPMRLLLLQGTESIAMSEADGAFS